MFNSECLQEVSTFVTHSWLVEDISVQRGDVIEGYDYPQDWDSQGSKRKTSLAKQVVLVLFVRSV